MPQCVLCLVSLGDIATVDCNVDSLAPVSECELKSAYDGQGMDAIVSRQAISELPKTPPGYCVLRDFLISSVVCGFRMLNDVRCWRMLGIRLYDVV